MILPPGTVTFLFTDIQGSTGLWEQYPQAMPSALAKHDALLRAAITANHGTVVKTTGDGLHAVFATAPSGLAAALAAQQTLFAEDWQALQPGLRVRMGLYTGEAEIRDGDYYGGTLNRAQRLMSLASGGQILLSQATADLVREGLPPGVSLRDLGDLPLKGLARSEHVYQLLHPSLPSGLPQLPSFNAVPTNLPVQLTSFIGREKEIQEITHLLESSRLITLTGSGGTGKTRLGQEVGARLSSQFPQGAWWVELAPLTEPSQVIPAIAQLFRLPQSGPFPLEVVLIEFLRQKNALLILDNCEHLIGECARLADELLHQCPHLKILASSREALGIAGEASYRIPSLSHNEAVRLFAERAGAANSMFHLTEDNTSAVMRICARLDGIPLAIELAAARTRLLSPEQIAARLDDRFRLLIGGSRTALPRQQTLRALIDWSYDLLTDHEKRLLRMTSVFNGGWTLDALLAVSVDTEADTLERLEQLVNKSLVVVDENGAVIRYSLLETIRQYAREKLLDSGADDITAVRGRHLAYYTALVAEINPRLYGPVLVDALDELELEQDNLRIALEWASDYDPLAMLQLTSNLTTFWGRRALATEGISWIQQSLDRVRYLSPGGPEASESLLRDKAKVLLGQGELLFELGKNSTALESVTASISLSRQLDDPQLLARALTMAAVIGGFLDRVSEARQWADEAFTLSRQGIYPYELALATGARLFQDIVTGHTVDSERLDEVIRVARLSRSPFILAMAISNVGRSEKFSGDYASALQHLDEACAFFTQMGDPYMQVSMRTETAHVYRLQGRYPEALSIYNETIRAFRDFNQLPAVAHVLECLAYVAVMQNQPDRAARLYGAAEMLRERLGSQMLSMERREYDESLVRLRTQLSEPALAHAWAQGRALDLDQVFATLL